MTDNSAILGRTSSHDNVRSCASDVSDAIRSGVTSTPLANHLRASPWRSVARLIQVVALTELLATATRHMARATSTKRKCRANLEAHSQRPIRWPPA